ncbi:TrkA C-terminal domain-containing protein [Thalassoglobus sp. JC818]|uniref:TrkA C-terminal domain-containing protein n=1 Tax=Thalassoglobus sp. JC818 TaxID=3232136 RepID=UPI0034575A41
MAAISSLLIVLTLSLLVTRVAAMALMLTGLSKEVARFQSRSAFTGVGFPAREAEEIVNHPIRRRIVMLLMLLGNLGIGAVVATLMVSFLQTSESQYWWLRLIFLAAGLITLWLIARNRYIERHLNRLISKILRRWGDLPRRNYAAILQLEGGFAVSELLVNSKDWVAGKKLAELRLPNEGVLVLGIRRGKDGKFVGTPNGATEVHANDTLILYGRVESVSDLDQRTLGRRGDEAHREAVLRHSSDQDLQDASDDDDDQRE